MLSGEHGEASETNWPTIALRSLARAAHRSVSERDDPAARLARQLPAAGHPARVATTAV